MVSFIATPKRLVVLYGESLLSLIQVNRPISNKRLPSINGLRAISILIVITAHFISPLLKYGLAYYPTVVFPLLSNGQFGVNMFFVISGFLITKLLLNEIQETGKISFRKFFTRRFLRLFPAYYFLLFIYLILDQLNYISISPASWLTAITYTKHLNWELDWATAHAWSLSIEENFYLLWPPILLLPRKFWKYPLIVICIVCPIIRVIYIETGYSYSCINNLTIFYRLDSIALGCLIAIYLKPILEIFEKYVNILLSCAFLWLLCMPHLYSLTRAIQGLHWLWPALGGASGTITLVAISVIMIHAVFFAEGWWYNLLNHKVMNYIGLLSYSLYLWQQIFSPPMGLVVSEFPINLLLLMAAAIFSYHVIEKPFLGLKEKFSA